VAKCPCRNLCMRRVQNCEGKMNNKTDEAMSIKKVAKSRRGGVRNACEQRGVRELSEKYDVQTVFKLIRKRKEKR